MNSLFRIVLKNMKLNRLNEKRMFSEEKTLGN